MSACAGCNRDCYLQDFCMQLYMFPSMDIHELLMSELLHQLIKGVFREHLVSWVLEYLHVTHGEKKLLEIIEDIDCWYHFSFLFFLLHRS